MERPFRSELGIAYLRAGVAISLAFIAFFTLTFFLNRDDSNRLKTQFEKSAKKARLVQTIRSELLASAEAEKSAVMADTDEASKAFAQQSVQASQNVEQARIEFGALIEKDSEETKLFHDFSSCLQKLQAIDRELLSLAVQNTNLQAMRLSFVSAAGAIRRMEAALNRVMDSAAATPDAPGIIRFASRAITAALTIHTLQAPHIAEITDAGMDEIEAKMKQLDEQVMDAFVRLDALVTDSAKPLIGEARKSYQDFQTINREIIDLSRRNSNILSSAISMGQKRTTMAQCLELLDALETAVLGGATYKATR
jgi:hypothetical protein